MGRLEGPDDILWFPAERRLPSGRSVCTPCALCWSNQGHSRASLVNVTALLVILLIAAVPETEATQGREACFDSQLYAGSMEWEPEAAGLTAPTVRKQREVPAGVCLPPPFRSVEGPSL